MGTKSDIEWTDSSWTPIRAKVRQDAAEIASNKGYASLVQIAADMAGHVGPHCEHSSPGCEQCYSETNNGRCLPSNGTGLPFDRRARDLVDIFVDRKILEQPLHWKRPRRVFVCSQTDLFGEFVTDEQIDMVFAVMALCPQHTFQVLTKRPERMLRWFAKPSGFTYTWREGYIQNAVYSLNGAAHFALTQWPLPNVWLGVSVENQKYADERIPLLLQTPAAIRFVSYEPALGPVDFNGMLADHEWNNGVPGGLNWIIAGFESGPGARPAEEGWMRSVKNQCVDAGVAFFYKQAALKGRKIPTPELDGQKWMQFPEVPCL